MFISRQKISIAIIVISIVSLATLIVFFGQWYFSQKVFYIFDYTYKLSSKQGELLTYTSGSGPDIRVYIDGEHKNLFIEQEEYKIFKSVGMRYKVLYPSGSEYEVIDNRGMLIEVDENGDWVPFMGLYAVKADGTPIIPEGRERYGPSSLITAAYEEYHTTQGTPFLYYFSFFVLIYGWCGYKYREFQNFLFIISLKWIWTESHEPNEFYYFMCKVGGIISMVGSLILFFMSL